jgi:hypothetical protein
MSVTQAEAEIIRSLGFRAEASLLDGPRVVKNCGGVYITLVPAPPDPDGKAHLHWGVWLSADGTHMAGGSDPDAVSAAFIALEWVRTNWA